MMKNNTREFVSLHDVMSSDDMRRIDLVYLAVTAANRLSDKKLKVEVEFTDGYSTVDGEDPRAKYAEVFVVSV